VAVNKPQCKDFAALIVLWKHDGGNERATRFGSSRGGGKRWEDKSEGFS